MPSSRLSTRARPAHCTVISAGFAGDSATADEVLQETYIRMLNAPRDGRPPAQRLSLQDRNESAARPLAKAEARTKNVGDERLHRACPPEIQFADGHGVSFRRLSAQERAILWLAHVEEMSHKEIGAILGVKEKSVRVMVFRARERAKELLEKAGFRGSHE